MVTHSWKITWVWDGWNSQKKIPLYTRLGTVTIEIHLSVYHRESSNNKRWKQLLFELPWRATPSCIAPGVSWIRWFTCVRWWRRGRGASSGGQRFRANYIWSWSERPATRYVPWQSTMAINPGKAINGLDTEKLLNCRTCGLHHLR